MAVVLWFSFIMAYPRKNRNWIFICMITETPSNFASFFEKLGEILRRLNIMSSEIVFYESSIDPLLSSMILSFLFMADNSYGSQEPIEEIAIISTILLGIVYTVPTKGGWYSSVLEHKAHKSRLMDLYWLLVQSKLLVLTFVPNQAKALSLRWVLDFQTNLVWRNTGEKPFHEGAQEKDVWKKRVLKFSVQHLSFLDRWKNKLGLSWTQVLYISFFIFFFVLFSFVLFAHKGTQTLDATPVHPHTLPP